jgi:hypothetical protein
LDVVRHETGQLETFKLVAEEDQDF